MHVLLSLLLLLTIGMGPPSSPASPPNDKAKLNKAVDSIEMKAIDKIIRHLSSPGMEGRDSPSGGLDKALGFVADKFAESGLIPAPRSEERWRQVRGSESSIIPGKPAGSEEGGTFYWPYSVSGFRNRQLTEPDPKQCRFEILTESHRQEFELDQDFVPVLGCAGQAKGALKFVGFGIRRKEDRYDDFGRKKLKGTIALVFDGEPRNRRRFEGKEVTPEASLWTKLGELGDRDVSGVIVVRRTPENSEIEAPPITYRATYALWNGARRDRRPRNLPPTIEISLNTATRLLGEDAKALAESLDRKARPPSLFDLDLEVSFESGTREAPQTLDNVVGWIPGNNPDLSDEVVVIGAHIDHIGVGSRGRIACGADDNASGVAAVLAIAQAAELADLPRSVMACIFTAEEDGLVGAREFCRSLPIPKGSIVAMINLDMIGRGPRHETVALGVEPNPGMNAILDRALSLRRTGLRKIVRCRDRGLFRLSDHYAFHEIGVPTVFFIEDFPISNNRDYHTWRDTADLVDMAKVTSTTKAAFNTLWVLATDPTRLPAPK